MIKITTTTESLTTIKADVLLLPLAAETDNWSRPALAVDRALQGRLRAAAADGFFTGKEGNICWVSGGDGLAARHVLMVGMGTNGIPDELQGYYRAIARAGMELREKKVKRVIWHLPNQCPCNSRIRQSVCAQKVVDELLYAQYGYGKYLSEKTASSLREIVLALDGKEAAREIQACARDGAAIAEGVRFARDLGNAPGNELNPAELAARARTLARQKGFKCTVLGEAEMKKLGMGGMLGVSQGSRQAPKLIILEYKKGSAGDPPVALVGKGLTFDSGGISIKPSDKMDEMKFDMCGAAAVLGVFHTVASLGRKINLIGVIPAAENMPGGNAQRPGDVITTMSGKTVEVLNTDAEGRLVLADALTYVQRYKPAAIVDLATLTGACVVALGHHATGLMTNDEALASDLSDAGIASGDRLWPLPLWKDYSEQIKGTVGDIANIGGRPGGALTAGAFLKEFINEGQAWAHLDIAGTAWTSEKKDWVEKGATGVGVRLLVRWLEDSWLTR